MNLQMGLFDIEEEESEYEQRYEYKTVSLNNWKKPKLLPGGHDPEKRLNKLAEDGWQYRGESEALGHSAYLIFERPVED